MSDGAQERKLTIEVGRLPALYIPGTGGQRARKDSPYSASQPVIILDRETRQLVAMRRLSRTHVYSSAFCNRSPPSAHCHIQYLEISSIVFCVQFQGVLKRPLRFQVTLHTESPTIRQPVEQTNHECRTMNVNCPEPLRYRLLVSRSTEALLFVRIGLGSIRLDRHDRVTGYGAPDRLVNSTYQGRSTHPCLEGSGGPPPGWRARISGIDRLR